MCTWICMFICTATKSLAFIPPHSASPPPMWGCVQLHKWFHVGLSTPLRPLLTKWGANTQLYFTNGFMHGWAHSVVSCMAQAEQTRPWVGLLPTHCIHKVSNYTEINPFHDTVYWYCLFCHLLIHTQLLRRIMHASQLKMTIKQIYLVIPNSYLTAIANIDR